MARFNHSGVLGALLVITFVLIIIHIGIAGAVADDLLDGNGRHTNNATAYLIIFSLLGDMLALATIMFGILHVILARDLLTRVALAISATQTFFVFALAFGFGCKQEDIGFTGNNQDATFAFTLFLALATLLLTIFSWLAYEWPARSGAGLASTAPQTTSKPVVGANTGYGANTGLGGAQHIVNPPPQMATQV